MDIPKTFKALLGRRVVESISYEPEESWIEDGKETGAIYWIYLEDRWNNGDFGSHIINGSTIKEVKERLGDVTTCNCHSCSRERLK